MYKRSKALTHVFRTLDQMAHACGHEDYDAFARYALELNAGSQDGRISFALGASFAEKALLKAAPRGRGTAVRDRGKIAAFIKRFPTKASIEEAGRKANSTSEPPLASVLQVCRQGRENMRKLLGLISEAARRPAAIIGRTLAGRKHVFPRTPETLEAEIQEELRRQEGNGSRPSREKAKATVASRLGCSTRTIEIILRDGSKTRQQH
jgi:hypothetical protein